MIEVKVKGPGLVGCSMIDSDTGFDLAKMVSVDPPPRLTLGALVVMEATVALLSVDISPEQVDWSVVHPQTGRLEKVAAIELRSGDRIEFAANGSAKVVSG